MVVELTSNLKVFGLIFTLFDRVQIAQPATKGNNSIFASSKIMYGPERVLPGRLSVSRTFGDIEAKYPKYGGLPNVVTAEPEIKTYKIHEGCDFIVLGCNFLK